MLGNVDHDSYDKDEQFDDTPNDDMWPENCYPNHQICNAHSLQLVVRNWLLECGSHENIAKVSNLVKYVRKYQQASELLENENRLQSTKISRWNMQLYIIQSVR